MMNKPQNIFNEDETRMQVVNIWRKVWTAKGTREVYVTKVWETFYLITLCDAEGSILPPY